MIKAVYFGDIGATKATTMKFLFGVAVFCSLTKLLPFSIISLQLFRIVLFKMLYDSLLLFCCKHCERAVQGRF